MPPKHPEDIPQLPSFDARNFEPPAWARKNYERSGHPVSTPTSPHEDEELHAAEHDVDDQEYEDAREGPGVDQEAGIESGDADSVRFTTDELKVR